MSGMLGWHQDLYRAGMGAAKDFKRVVLALERIATALETTASGTNPTVDEVVRQLRSWHGERVGRRSIPCDELRRLADLLEEGVTS
jgi:hypothetical protein